MRLAVVNPSNDISPKTKEVRIEAGLVTENGKQIGKVVSEQYIKVIEIMITNPQAKPEDIPMLIDVEHYKKALAKRGPLSEKEKIKAEEYYQAVLKYPHMAGINLINPFSGYRTNILEKEARQASRAKTGRI